MSAAAQDSEPRADGAGGNGAVDEYEQFIRAKQVAAPARGFEPPLPLHEELFPWQRVAVAWALRLGRAALFESFGLGKTRQQLEFGRQVAAHTGGRFLQVAPLGVRDEFETEGAALRITPWFVQRTSEVEGPGHYLTNYESIREGKLDVALFDGAALDEADCLRGMGGSKTFREAVTQFEAARVRFRLVGTATPAPNDFEELLAYAEWLGVMDISQAKAQPLDAKILTPAGWKLMGEIEPGDEVIAGDGSVTRVLGVYPQGERPIYRVTFSDGASTECDAEHLWLTRTQYERNNERRYVDRNGPTAPRAGRFASVRTTAEIAETLTTPAGSANHSIPTVGAVHLEARPTAVDPWLLGALLGDAHLRDTCVTFSTVDEWMLERVRAALPEGLSLRVTARGTCDYGITTTGQKGGRGPNSNPLLCALRTYGLLGKRSWEKSIPQDYLFNRYDVRLAVLRGLMDTDGTVDPSNGPTLTTTSRQLADDVQWLVRSLGGLSVIALRKTPRRDAYKVSVSLPAGVNPFSLPRKAEKAWTKSERARTRYITSIEPVGTKPAQCIAIEHPSRLYVTDDFVVTHNTRFFQRDSEKADNLTLRPHKEAEFWAWVTSWGLFVSKPSDLGDEFADDDYTLPELRVHWHEIPSDHGDAGEERDGQRRLLKDAALGVVAAAREKRSSLPARVAKVRELVAALRGPDGALADQPVIWCDLNDEQAAIERALAAEGVSAASLTGSQDADTRLALLRAWKRRERTALVTKPVLYGAGVNLQQSHTEIFAGIGFKFREFIQAIHREHRFGQRHAVDAHVVYTDAECEVKRALLEKWARHDELVAQMTALVRAHGLTRSAMAPLLTRATTVARREASGARWWLANNDTVRETRALASDRFGLILTSIPFGNQYDYSPSYLDFGHTDDAAHFWRQMDYLTPELLRVLAPGRDCVVHVKDRIVPSGLSDLGFRTVYPFHADCIAHFRRHGFGFLGQITVATDVVRENAGTYRLSYTEQCKDGSKQGAGLPEYLLLFRKPPTDRSREYADVPVAKSKQAYRLARWQIDAAGVWRSSGNRLLSADELRTLEHHQIYKAWRQWCLTHVYDYEHHVALTEALEDRAALPTDFSLMPVHVEHPAVWTDVARMRTLNGAQSAAGREQHLCPLQLDIVDRVITQRSMPGEEVYDPFAGIGTVPSRAVALGRRGAGAELNTRYFDDAVRFCRAAEREATTPTLFDLLAAPEVPDASAPAGGEAREPAAGPAPRDEATEAAEGGE